MFCLFSNGGERLHFQLLVPFGQQAVPGARLVEFEPRFLFFLFQIFQMSSCRADLATCGYQAQQERKARLKPGKRGNNFAFLHFFKPCVGLLKRSISLVQCKASAEKPRRKKDKEGRRLNVPKRPIVPLLQYLFNNIQYLEFLEEFKFEVLDQRLSRALMTEELQFVVRKVSES